MTNPQATLYTIGYEGWSLEDLIQRLKAHEVNILIDIRERPYSQRREFCKSRLKTAVEAEGIRYLHMKAMGAPKMVRDELRERGNWQTFRRMYAEHLMAQRQALDALCETCRTATACLLCREL